MGLFKWATRGLQVGDLSALRELARGWRPPEQDQMERLLSRGFVKTGDDGRSAVTLLGRVALYVRSLAKP
jgi:hypothetical protein